MCSFSRVYVRGENRTLPGRFTDVNWGSRPFDFPRCKEMEEGEEGPEMREGMEVVGEERQNGTNTHRLLRLSGHDEGIRQRRSCRS